MTRWAFVLGAVVAFGVLPGPAVATDSAPEVTVAAVGDIACNPNERAYDDGLGTPAGCRQKAVSDVIRGMQPSAFLALGDIQHHNGTYDEFMSVYDKQFGDLLPITRPIPGNHEYNTPGGAGYYQYFGAAAHQATNGNYSFRAGSWHILAINSTACTPTRPCGPGSPLAKWIAAEVAANPTKCLAAMWHHPLWSAGNHGNNLPMAPVWNQLHSYGADLVLHGHDHGYQRSHPLGTATISDTGVLSDPVVTDNGMVQFVVATGGQNNFRIPAGNPATTNAMAAIGANASPAVFGALRLHLGDGRYRFDFVPAEGTTFTDSGEAACRQKTPPTDVPAKPVVTVTRGGDGTATVTWAATRWSDRLPVSYTARVVGRARQCVTTQNSCTITGLTNGEQYSIVVSASNEIADVPSDPVSFIPAVRPARPGNVTAAVAGDRVTVSWTAPATTGGLPVQYRVSSPSNGPGCRTSATTCTFTAPVGRYTFTVFATNEVGDSLGVAAPVVQVSAPPTPIVSSLARAGDGRISVTLSGPPAAGWESPSYVVTSTPGRRSCTTTGTSCVISGLVNGTSYTFTAVMRTARLTSTVSAPSAALVAGRVPVRPAAPTVVAAGPGSMTISWNPPSSDGGLPISGYEVLIGNGPTVVCRTTALTCTATGLMKGTSYWFTVVAVNEAGRSANSPGSVILKSR